jgi:hypothetical protein
MYVLRTNLHGCYQYLRETRNFSPFTLSFDLAKVGKKKDLVEDPRVKNMKNMKLVKEKRAKKEHEFFTNHVPDLKRSGNFLVQQCMF